MKYHKPSAPDSCAPLMITLMMILTLRKDKQNKKVLLHVYLFCRVCRQCTVCLRAHGDRDSY